MTRHHSIRLSPLAITAAALAALALPASATEWHVPGDFATIQQAIDANDVATGDRIRVGTGNHAGALVTKSVEIMGEGGATIDDGPLHPAGLSQGFRLLAGSGGTTISHLRFEVDLAIMNGDAVGDVTVTQCTFVDAIQGISNWRGNNWDISHNQFVDLRTRNGGGIGILVGDYSGGVVTGNIVAHNTVEGVLHVDAEDGGGYAGSGIVIYADFRWGRSGGELHDNRIAKNTVSLESDTPEVVDIVAVELTDTRDLETDMVHDNAIGFNDLRGTELQIALTPEELDGVNDISRNLGENRGHGLHPSLFGTNTDAGGQ